MTLQGTNTYTISPNETLYSISRKTGISVEQLRKLNGLSENAAIFPGQTLKLSAQNEITYINDISDNEILRNEHIKEVKNPDYKVVQGDNYSKIADKFNVEVNYLLKLNNLNPNDTLSLGQILKIPSTRTAENVVSLKDVAETMGVSVDFIKKIKNIEDGLKDNGKPYGEKEFHNSVYVDSEGHKTIGIGHVVKKGEPEHLSNQEVLNTLANDLLKMEENLWAVVGKKQYERLPQGIKEALLDMTFNKGTDILENSEGLLWCLKNEKYEAAINKMTNIKTLKGNELSGLCKRRLLDISLACKIYDGNIPNSNLATVQNLYNKGVELLKQECKKSGANFENQLVGYNDYVKQLWGNKVKLQ